MQERSFLYELRTYLIYVKVGEKNSLIVIDEPNKHHLKTLEGIGGKIYLMIQEIKDKMAVADAFVKDYSVSCTEKLVTDGTEDLLCMVWYSSFLLFRYLDIPVKLNYELFCTYQKRRFSRTINRSFLFPLR